MAESIHEQVVAAILTSLEAIVGDGGTTYWYTPSKVIRYGGFTDACLNPMVGDPATIYVLIPSEEERTPFAMGGRWKARCILDIVAAQRFVPATEDPFNPPSPDRWQIQNRLARDIERKLLAGATVGGLAIDTEVQVVDRDPEDTHVDGWAVVLLRTLVEYEYAETAP